MTTIRLGPFVTPETVRPGETRPRVLLIGTPSSLAELTQWELVRRWAVEHGLTPTRELDDRVVYVVATDNVLDGLCTPAEATLVQRARSRGVPCGGVDEALRDPGEPAEHGGFAALPK
ncbi:MULTISPECIES: hypothetical protein [unclassified Rhodococcus (in: high G+C Gram-positive bacteria)]|uniref:hypothetical protein n=1 Tax=Rhodococcus sp. SJ-3 TaxID=3454628 RepID=UPI002D88EA78|nr:hypothetical protein [Rhodococcus sp. (in: high G+C Gram-positive bacteria)]